MAKIVFIPGRGYDSNCYLIVDKKTVLIDTGTGSTQKLLNKQEVASADVELIVNTHAHFDHVGGNRLFEANVAVHKADTLELENGNLYGTSELFGHKAQSKVDMVLNDGDIIETGDISLEVIHTPGHTPGSVCLLSNRGHLFSGDTLFSGGSFGRTDLPGGSTHELFRSLERLKSTTFEFLMPGHMDCVKNGKAHLEAALELLGDVYERV
jgi:glyoxylase-like metal-dependent hydrolase (beta-lactamase superfamily II)